MKSNVKKGRNRTLTRVAVYLIGMRGEKILLGKRQNTGHMDGYWSLVAGHVIEGESCSAAMIREAHEECGLQLTKRDLQFVGAMHHYSPPYDYVHYAFMVDLGLHEPTNMEPHKCEQLVFHDTNNLPCPMSAYIVEIIQRSVTQNMWLAEYGWKY